MKAMIFAAGLGTRLKPLTDTLPKALVKVNGVPMLERTILHLKRHGITDIIINVHHLADQVEQFLKDKDHFDLNLQVSDERELLLDTGGGLKKASWFFNDKEDFIAINSDIITDLDLQSVVNYHKKNDAMATLVVRERKSSRCFLFDQNFKLSGWKNESNSTSILTNESTELKGFPFSGIHVINSSLFKYITREGKFSIVDTYLELSKTKPIYGFLDKGTTWFDIGDAGKLKLAEKALGNN